MKFTKKSLVAMLTMFTLLVTLFTFSTPTEVSAKTKTKTYKLTMYVGEQYQISPFLCTFKKAKSSKKKVCTAKKKGSYVIITAKKAGKSKVTIKSNKGNFVYKVTVKKVPFQVATYPMEDGVLVAVKNTSKTYFSSVDIQLTFCDANGVPLNQGATYVYNLGGKQTAYTQKFYSTYGSTVNLGKTKARVLKWSRSDDVKIKNFANKVNVNLIKTPATSAYSTDKLKFNCSMNYTGTGSILVNEDIFCYGAGGKLLKVINASATLSSTKNIYTDDVGYSLPEGCVSYKVASKRIYERRY